MIDSRKNKHKEFKKLLECARLEAIDLGYNYISGLHFLLADCLSNDETSIKNFIFKDELSFKNFYDAQRKQDLSVFRELDKKSLPLTKDAENIISAAIDEAKLYGHKELKAYHLFLGSCKIRSNLITDKNNQQENLYPRLLDYYRGKGLIFNSGENTINRIINFFQKKH